MFKKLAYVFFIFIILVLCFVIYSISAGDTNIDIKEKAKTELHYFESKIIYMFNSLNNIEFENYKISIEDISKNSQKSSEETSSAGNGDDSSGGSSSENEGESNSSTINNENQNESEKTKKYSLNSKGILNSEKDVNWNYIKNEAELLQNSISTMILDLYELSLNENDILNFNKEFDNLLVNLKNEDKQSVLRELVILYSYIPKFIKNCNVDIQTEVVYSTKYSVFKAYSILDSENWDEILKYLQEAIDKFSILLTDINIQNKNQYVVNKCYILINELQNSANLKDKEIFLIKYRNLLEDLNNM